jgi:hypothetical protein
MQSNVIKKDVYRNHFYLVLISARRFTVVIPLEILRTEIAEAVSLKHDGVVFCIARLA